MALDARLTCRMRRPGRPGRGGRRRAGHEPAAAGGGVPRVRRQHPGGTGPGLAIVHRLVTADGGAAALSDTRGGGLTVILGLPAGPAGRAAHAADGISAKAAIPYQF